MTNLFKLLLNLFKLFITVRDSRKITSSIQLTLKRRKIIVLYNRWSKKAICQQKTEGFLRHLACLNNSFKYTYIFVCVDI